MCEMNASVPAIEEDSVKTVTKITDYVVWNSCIKYVIIGIASFSSFCSGCLLSWSSAAVPLLQLTEEGLQMSAYQGSWVASIVLAGALFGALTAFKMADFWGRKRSLQICSILMIVTWMLIGFSESFYGILLGRFIGGFAVGTTSELTPLYVDEICFIKCREMATPLCQLQLAAGILFEYVIGVSDNLTIISVTSCLLVLAHFIALSFLPESPFYIYNSNTDDAHQKTLKTLKSLKHPDPEQELVQIRERAQNLKNQIHFTNEELKSAMKDKAISRACAVGALLMFFQQLSGATAILFYAVKIFTKSGSVFTPVVSAVALGAVYVMSTSSSSFVFERFGRRIILLVSASVMCLTLCSLGIYIHLQATYDFTNYSHIPLMCLTGAIAAHAVGFGPIPHVMITELFPNEMQTIIQKFVTAFHWILAFAVTKTFRGVMDIIGPGWLFWNFGSACFFAALFVMFCVPETKSRNLEEIQIQLRGNRSSVEPSLTNIEIRIDDLSVSEDKN